MSTGTVQPATATPIQTMITAVSHVEDVHPALRRVTLTGPAIGDLVLPGPEAFFHLLLPPPGRATLTVDTSFTWEAYSATPEGDRPRGAYYTVWEHRPASAEIDVLVVLHGGVATASAWAARANPGDPVAIWGPRTTFAPPPAARRWVLCADETGTPAAAGVLRARPPGTPAIMLLETDTPATRQPLGDLPDVEVRWCYRRGRPAGSTTLLPDALADESPGSDAFVWAGAEHEAVAAVRDIVAAAGVRRSHRSLLAYWRRSAPTT